jgi:hypothetical protein
MTPTLGVTSGVMLGSGAFDPPVEPSVLGLDDGEGAGELAGSAGALGVGLGDDVGWPDWPELSPGPPES